MQVSWAKSQHDQVMAFNQELESRILGSGLHLVLFHSAFKFKKKKDTTLF